jgi:formylmethanofuran dehydrogenase subunit C
MNRFAVKFLFLFFIFFSTATLTSCSGEISGTISVKGNMPHTYLAITADDGRVFKVTGNAKDELWNNYQGSKVTIKGKIISMPQGFMPGEIDAESIVK